MKAIKTEARNQAFARRKAVHGVVDPAPAQAHLLAWIRQAPARIVSGYMPIRTEIDPRPVMAELAKTAQVCVPVIDAAGQPLRFAKWTPGCAMRPGTFGAMIPVEPEFLVPDTLIVPLAAFDATGARLGYGGGFYDRTLAGLQAGPGKVRAAGFAYSGQRIDAVPVEPTDVLLDAVITEDGVQIPA